MTVVVVSDDLIWSTRLASMLQTAGAEPAVVRSAAALALAPAAAHVVVDLGARSFDGVEVVAAAVARGARVLALGEHDDPGLRAAALAAGADRFLAYRRVATDGPALLAAWLHSPAAPTPDPEASPA